LDWSKASLPQVLAKTTAWVKDYNATQDEELLRWGRKTNLAQSIIDQAQLNLDAIAVIDAKGSYSYRALLEKAYGIAAYVEKQVGSHQPVGVLLEKGFDQAAACLGIVCAGCYYVPLSLLLPTERLKKIIGNGNIHCVMSNKIQSDHHCEVNTHWSIAQVIAPEKTYSLKTINPY
jgi:non-ribosomal peptide synthetase component F